MTEFFVDENLPPLVTRALAAIFTKHRFRSASDENLRGVDDIQLCVDLGSRGFGAIITSDRNQLVRDEERAALKAARLHWIGLPRIDAHGVTLIAAQLSLTVPAVADLLDSWPTEPTALRLRDHVSTVRVRELL